MKAKNWILVFSVLTLLLLFFVVGLVCIVDPFFHFHAPLTDVFYYTLDSERYQNNGILRHFDYDAIITGTSMTENFRTTEFDDIFGVKSVKVSYANSSIKEQADTVAFALERNPRLKAVICSLDIGSLLDNKDKLNYSLDLFPTYLYDNDPLNDAKYIFNMDTFKSRIFPMVLERYTDDFAPGITSFDEYNRWHSVCTYGLSRFQNSELSEPSEFVHLTEEEKLTIVENIAQNLTALPKQYPDTTFYYFFPPYSIIWWKGVYQKGTIFKYFEAEKLYAEELHKYDNIRLYSFNTRPALITDMNFYKDDIHYGSWINSAILRWMHDGDYRLTADNYQSVIDEETRFISGFDFSSVFSQPDYKNDEYAGALINHEITGAEPLDILNDEICCSGYGDAEFSVPECKPYNYLVFNGRKTAGVPEPLVEIVSEAGEILRSFDLSAEESAEKQYVLDLYGISGNVSIVFSAVPENSEAQDAGYIFSDIILY